MNVQFKFAHLIPEDFYYSYHRDSGMESVMRLHIVYISAKGRICRVDATMLVDTSEEEIEQNVKAAIYNLERVIDPERCKKDFHNSMKELTP